MTTQVDRATTRVRLEVSEDRLAVHVVLDVPEGEPPVEVQEILDALAEANVVVDEYVRAQVQELVALTGREGVTEPFLVAKGCPVVEGRDAEFVWDAFFEQAAREWQEDAPVNFYTCNTIVTADAGQTVGRITPARPGQAGYDVFGHPIQLKRRPKEITLADSVMRSTEDPNTIVSRVPGRVSYKNHALAVDEILDIRGDVDFETGSIQSSVDVHIGGTVRDNFHVRSEKAITVSGAIEAAEISAGGDVVVRGGILGHHRGRVGAEGEIVAKFCEQTCLHSRGSIKIARLIMDSRLHADHQVCAERAAIIGGLIYARERVEAASLGSEAHVPTLLVLGVHWDVVNEARALDKSIEEMRKVSLRLHEVADPLMANIRRLNPSQKERATELLFKIQEIDLAMADREQQRDQMLCAAGAELSPSVHVSKIVHTGVRIRLNNRETEFNKSMKGPIRIEQRVVDRATEIVAVNQLTGSVTILNSERIEGDPTPQLETAECAA